MMFERLVVRDCAAYTANLRIPRLVEFAGFEDDAEGDPSPAEGYDTGIQLPNPNADKANAQQGRSLEALLATKNKRLLEELTKFRVCQCVFLLLDANEKI